MRNPNIVLLTVDALRYDVLKGMLDNGECGDFHRYASQFNGPMKIYANGVTTYDSMPGIFASKIPALTSYGIQPHERSFVQHLQEGGYFTVGINQGNPWCSSLYRFNAGFREFFDYLETPKSDAVQHEHMHAHHYREPQAHGRLKKFIAGRTPDWLYDSLRRLRRRFRSSDRSDPALYKRLFELRSKFERQVLDLTSSVCDLKAPFFLWIHFMDAHSPYITLMKDELDPEIIGLNVDFTRGTREIEKVKSLYRHAIFYIFHRLITGLLEKLSARDALDNTVVVITSDHGEEFYEHKEGGHNPYQCYRETHEVPCLIKLPEHLQAAFQNGVFRWRPPLAQLIDMPPTLLDFAGVPYDHKRFLGRSWLQRTMDRTYTVTVSGPSPELATYDSEPARENDRCFVVLTKDWKMIQYKKQTKLFRGVDEWTNLAAQYPSVVADGQRLIENMVNRAHRYDEYNFLLYSCEMLGNAFARFLQGQMTDSDANEA